MESSGNNGQSARGRGAGVQLSEAQHATLQLLRHLSLLWSRWITIVLVTIGVGLGYGLYTKFLTVKWYRAQATITPIPPDQGLSIGTGAGDMLEGVGGGLGSLLSFGGASDSVTLAERYIAIMDSYAFTTDLINRYHLTQTIVGVRSKNAPTVTKWSLHKQIASRFSAEYDYKSANLSLYFLDPSPQDAQQILGYYLDSLRNKLRNEEVQSAASAAESLQEEVRKTSDALLQNQLYELMARQIQREKVSQVQADFAFKVVEPPVVPDNYYQPRARDNAILGASVSFALVCIWILGADFIRRAKAQFEAANSEFEQPAPAWTTGEPPARIDDAPAGRPSFVRNLRPKA
ncbi:MAG: lipopolysaccharide biosynthesis protein [Candidatus Binatus sp.]|nr:lipopolysaccharide biosynthesis protein [Candidatus Binatus sp.]